MLRISFWALVHYKPCQEESVLYAPTVKNINSSSVQALAMNKQASTRAKHIELRYHYAEYALEKKLVVWQDLLSADNQADVSTKMLDFKTLEKLTHIIILS